MKAIQCVEWGDPSKLVLAELPLPEPGAAQVRIRIAAAGVNFPDALIVQRKYHCSQVAVRARQRGGRDRRRRPLRRRTHVKTAIRVIAFVVVGGVC